MGDIADQITEDNELLWFDHLAGHHVIPTEECPYCKNEEDEQARADQADDGDIPF